MKDRLRSEWQAFKKAVGTLDRQTMFVLTATAALVIVQHAFGSRRLFRRELAHLVPEAWEGLASWGWWFGFQGITGFHFLKGLFKARHWQPVGDQHGRIDLACRQHFDGLAEGGRRVMEQAQ